MGQMILDFIMESGFAQMDIKQVIVIALACLFINTNSNWNVISKYARCRFNESSNR